MQLLQSSMQHSLTQTLREWEQKLCLVSCTLRSKLIEEVVGVTRIHRADSIFSGGIAKEPSHHHLDIRRIGVSRF